ncbi:MAG: endolytic transglycosylase MltG [Proteobacteria bacterium]|nr:endolytic transglycosylase MltG [Pseudomonadota bacterium]
MKKIIIYLSLAVAISGSLLLWWLSVELQKQLQQPLNLQTKTTLHIKPGSSLQAISHEMVARKWLSHPYYLLLEGRRQGVAGAIKTGEYEILPGMTALAVLNLIVSGKVVQYSLTIVEGWSFKQIMQALKESEILEQTLAVSDPEYVMAAIGYAGHLAEGRFFPDTYNFPAGTTDVDFLRRAYKAMQQILSAEWQHRATGLPYASPYQALTMASIIEKETAISTERSKIAGVFVRRLQQHMKLQTDPTVIYAMAESFDGNIRQKDLSIDSPYNTYRYKGLPPTPIASPGRASINAALHPQEGDSLYFVAKGDGTHYFSSSLAEHNNAVAKYQLKKR